MARVGSKRSPVEKRWVWLAATVSAVAIGLTFWRARPPESLEEALKTTYTAVRNADAGTTMRYIPEAERKAVELDTTKLGRLLAWTSQCTQKLQTEPTPRMEIGDRGHFGVGEWFLKPAGRNVETSYYFVGFVDEQNRPYCLVTSACVTAAIQAKYGHLFPELPRNERAFRVLGFGLKNEKPVLEAMGLKGVVSSDRDMKLRPWDKMARFADWAAKRRAAQRVALR